MKKRAANRIIKGVTLLLATAFVLRFGGINLLRRYIELGIGDCVKIPILCRIPAQEAARPALNAEYIPGLIPYKFPKFSISLPRGFDVVQEAVKKVYYKRRKKGGPNVVYLLHQPPGFFTGLYPQVKAAGINNNYDFIKRTMYARVDQINSINDAFFLVMKSIFTPDLGDQSTALMEEIEVGDKRAFVNYNISDTGNYFDCNVIGAQDNFFKVYIKDKGAKLALDEVAAIIATIKRAE